MTKDELDRTLRHMERLRHDAMEAEGEEKQRILREYDKFWDMIKDELK